MAVRLSALRAGRPPFTSRKISGTHFCYRLSLTQGHSADGKIRFIETFNDVIGDGRKLHNEELHNLYSSPSMIRMIKSKRMR
jgi:hypothetical protein